MIKIADSVTDKPFLLLTNIINKNVTATIKIALVRNIKKLFVIGEIIAVIPKTKVELQTTLPIASPTAKSPFLAKTALVSNTNSGKEVPIATKNKPISMAGNNSSTANCTAYFTTKCALKNKAPKQSIKKRMFNAIPFLLLSTNCSFNSFRSLIKCHI